MKYCVLLFLLTFSLPAYAYLDPGTGSMFLQLLFAGFLAVLYAMKLFWGNIKKFFINLHK